LITSPFAEFEHQLRSTFFGDKVKPLVAIRLEVLAIPVLELDEHDARVLYQHQVEVVVTTAPAGPCQRERGIAAPSLAEGRAAELALDPLMGFDLSAWHASLLHESYFQVFYLL